jgi:hypothetical protein
MEGILNPEAEKNLATMSSNHAYVNRQALRGSREFFPG